MNITQINLDGLDLISNDYSFVVEGLFNFDKDIVTNNLYFDGVSYNSSKMQSKKLLLNGFVKSNDVNKILALNKVLMPNRLKVLTLNIDGLGEINCKIEITNRSTGNNSKIISCQFVMPSPYLYSTTTNTVSLGAVSDNGIVYPLTYPITFGNVTGAEGIITNTGNVLSYPVIVIRGTCGNLVIKNITTGENMSLNVSLTANDILVIDNRPGTRGIFLNDVKRLDLKNGNWISCIVGENTFNFQRTSLESDKQHCSVTLQSRYI